MLRSDYQFLIRIVTSYAQDCERQKKILSDPSFTDPDDCHLLSFLDEEISDCERIYKELVKMWDERGV